MICRDVSAFFFSSDRIALISPAVPCWKMKSFLAPVRYIIIQAKAVQVFKIMFGLLYCQDFIVFHRDFVIFLWLLQAVNYYGNYRLCLNVWSEKL